MQKIPGFQAGIVRITKEKLELQDKGVVVEFPLFGFENIVGHKLELVSYQIKIQAESGPTLVIGAVIGVEVLKLGHRLQTRVKEIGGLNVIATGIQTRSSGII